MLGPRDLAYGLGGAGEGPRMQGQFFDIIFLAMVAGFIAFRLYGVLGRRTGHERSPDEQVRVPDPPRAQKQAAKDNVVALPERAVVRSAANTGPLGRALMDVKLADRSFNEDRFMEGARGAYEMIVAAFAQGDRDALRGLVNDDVFATFDEAIRGREREDFTFAGLKSARITGAELKDKTTEITVSFESEIVMIAYDSSGTPIEGDTQTPNAVTDIWTFARRTNTRDPNWTLVGTATG